MSLESILSEDDRKKLELTQNIREQFILELKEHGVPSDKENKNLIVKLLDGMDKAVLAKAKIVVDDQSNKNSEETNQLIAGLLAKHKVQPSRERTEAVELPDTVQYTDPVEGETEQGISTLTYEEFMSKSE